MLLRLSNKLPIRRLPVLVSSPAGRSPYVQFDFRIVVNNARPVATGSPCLFLMPLYVAVDLVYNEPPVHSVSLDMANQVHPTGSFDSFFNHSRHHHHATPLQSLLIDDVLRGIKADGPFPNPAPATNTEDRCFSVTFIPRRISERIENKWKPPAAAVASPSYLISAIVESTRFRGITQSVQKPPRSGS